MNGFTFRTPVRTAELAVELSEQRRTSARGRKAVTTAGRALSEGAKALAARHAERTARAADAADFYRLLTTEEERFVRRQETSGRR